MLTYADVNARHLGPELHACPLLDGAGLGELEVDKVATPSGQEDLRGGGEVGRYNQLQVSPLDSRPALRLLSRSPFPPYPLPPGHGPPL